MDKGRISNVKVEAGQRLTKAPRISVSVTTTCCENHLLPEMASSGSIMLITTHLTIFITKYQDQEQDTKLFCSNYLIIFITRKLSLELSNLYDRIEISENRRPRPGAN